MFSRFFLLLGSGSTFPEVDPDPAKWYGFNRIRIRNTGFITMNLEHKFCSEIKLWKAVTQQPVAVGG